MSRHASRCLGAPPTQTQTSRLVGLLIIGALGACTNEAIYNKVQRDNQLECQKKPAAAREECMARNSQSYESYERALQDLKKTGSERP